MENGQAFVPPILTKRAFRHLITPFCIQCAKDVDRWLYHMNGHTDGTPILVLSCHNMSVTVGSSLAGADEFRKQMDELYFSGLARIYWNADGTVNGPNESPHAQPSAHAAYRAGSNADVDGDTNQTNG